MCSWATLYVCLRLYVLIGYSLVLYLTFIENFLDVGKTFGYMMCNKFDEQVFNWPASIPIGYHWWSAPILSAQKPQGKRMMPKKSAVKIVSWEPIGHILELVKASYKKVNLQFLYVLLKKKKYLAFD